jgi:hypothetical protein
MEVPAWMEVWIEWVDWLIEEDVLEYRCIDAWLWYAVYKGVYLCPHLDGQINE